MEPTSLLRCFSSTHITFYRKVSRSRLGLCLQDLSSPSLSNQAFALYFANTLIRLTRTLSLLKPEWATLFQATLAFFDCYALPFNHVNIKSLLDSHWLLYFIPRAKGLHCRPGQALPLVVPGGWPCHSEQRPNSLHRLPEPTGCSLPMSLPPKSTASPL